jgi:hypothetical protein
MPFESIPGLKGKVYVPPAEARRPAKHPCKDCFYCQQYSEERCGVCRGRPAAVSSHCTRGKKSPPR